MQGKERRMGQSIVNNQIVKVTKESCIYANNNNNSRQRMFVRWGDTCSTSFCATNGVKQGGIISPMLFNLYMDDLSLMLNCSGIGG